MMVLAILIGSSVLTVVMGIILLSGRGSFLLAGYNTMSKSKKEEFRKKYDIDAICRFAGKLAILIGILIPLYGIEGITYSWLVWVLTAVVTGICLFAIVYVNTGKRFRN